MITTIHAAFVTVCAILGVYVSSKPFHFAAAANGIGAGFLVPGDPACDRSCAGQPTEYYCASNGRTLDSICRFNEAKCNDPYLNATEGKCPSSIRCLTEKRYILKVQSLTSGHETNNDQPVHVPTCKDDGSYAPIQCSIYLGYCWCVTPVGRMIKNSTFEIGRKPSCGRSRPRERKSKCKNDAEKAAFAIKLRELIVQGSRVRLKSSTMRRSVVTAKHAQMDKNVDGSLNAREMKKLLKPYRKKLPRSCIRVFMAFCDVNDNKKVSEFEWSICLGVRPFKRKERVVITRPSDVLQEEVPDEVISGPTISQENNENLQTMPQTRRTCKETRNALIKDRKSNVKIPQCEAEPNDQYWSPVQCYNQYCYCVVRESGTPIAGTATTIKDPSMTNRTPNCKIADLSPEISVPIPGCKKSLKRKFLSQVQNLLVHEMLRAHGSTEPYPTNPTPTTKERAARWYFDVLDKSENRLVSRKEIKKFKKLLTKGKVSKKCLKNFTKHCDRDSNGKISKGEFITCLEVRQQEKFPSRAEFGRSINQLKTTDDPDNL